MGDLFNQALPDRALAAKRRVAAIRLSEPLPDPQLRVLNLGGGVQSSALALMSARGELERLDAAIFADTGWESARTYAYLDWLEGQVPFPIMRVRKAGADLGQHQIEGVAKPKKGRHFVPFFITEPDTILPKFCSGEWKRRVVHLALRQMLGLAHGQQGPRKPVVEQWLGMTTDELQRIGTSEKRYLHHRYPLIERRMSKRDLYPWYELRQLPIPPKSSCIFCPFNDPGRFRELLAHPTDGPRLIEFDRAIRPGFAGMEGRAYLTKERRPIDQCDFRTAEDRGQIGFGDYCGDGDCGT